MKKGDREVIPGARELAQGQFRQLNSELHPEELHSATGRELIERSSRAQDWSPGTGQAGGRQESARLPTEPVAAAAEGLQGQGHRPVSVKGGSVLAESPSPNKDLPRS